MNEGMKPQELFDLIKTYCEFDEESTIGCVVELLGEIRNNPNKFCNELYNITEDYADMNNKCPICGADYNTKITYNEESEYQGLEVQEEIYEKECPNCGILD